MGNDKCRTGLIFRQDYRIKQDFLRQIKSCLILSKNQMTP